MKRVYSQEESSLSNICHAAIAIQSVDSNQRHIGVLHREDGSDEVSLLHLAWHHDLRNHPPKTAYLWVDPKIPSRRMRQVAAFCRKVWRSNDNDRAIPYALSPPNDCFDRLTGKFLLGPTRLGLTCASFVLAIFESVGLPLAKYETWPKARDGDQEWQECIIDHLEKSQPPATTEHVEAVKGEVGAIRYRPEDVAGAAITSPLPADFASAEELAALIVARLG